MFTKSVCYGRQSRFAAVAAAFAVTGAASGSYIGAIEMQYVGKGLGSSVRIDTGSGVQNVFAGEILYTTRSGTGAGAIYDAITLPAFCIEPTQQVQTGWLSYAITDPDSAATPMMTAQRAAALNGVVDYFYSQRAAGMIDNAAATGFQVALWEIIRDFDDNSGRASLDLAGGTFKATKTDGTALASNVSDWASLFFDVASSSQSFDGSPAFVFHSATSQDQIIPVPGGMTLACLSLMAFASRRRR